MQEFLSAAWAAVAPLAGVAVGWWLARRAARDDERRSWALEFRRILGRVNRVTDKYLALISVGPAVAESRHLPIGVGELRREGWRLWLGVAQPAEDDFLLYLEVLTFIPNELRIRAILDWHHVMTDPDQVEDNAVRASLASLGQTLGELTVSIDRALGLRTPRSKLRPSGVLRRLRFGRKTS